MAIFIVPNSKNTKSLLYSTKNVYVFLNKKENTIDFVFINSIRRFNTTLNIEIIFLIIVYCQFLYPHAKRVSLLDSLLIHKNIYRNDGY